MPAKRTSWEACVKCGIMDGYRDPKSGSVRRFRGEPFGFTGELCNTCFTNCRWRVKHGLSPVAVDEPLKPCAKCGDPAGYITPGNITPRRSDGKPFGISGGVCHRCYRKLSGEGKKRPTFTEFPGVTPDSTKVCTVCHVPKLLTEYYKDSRNKQDGRYSKCKPCHAHISQEWQKAHPREACEIVKRSYRKNPQKAIKRTLSYREDPEYMKKQLEWNANYKRNNPGKVNAICAGRRARLLKATPPWTTPDMKKEIEAIYESREAKTDHPNWQVDHIHPLQGDNFSGLHVPWNLEVIPKAENLSKKNKLPDTP